MRHDGDRCHSLIVKREQLLIDLARIRAELTDLEYNIVGHVLATCKNDDQRMEYFTPNWRRISRDFS